MEFGLILSIALAVFALILLGMGVNIVQQSQCMVVERLGSFNRVMTSGFNLIIPFVEVARPVYWLKNGILIRTNRIDLRETVLDVPEQSVITKDNVSITIDALLYIQVVDSIRATYEIANLPMAVSQLAQTTLRNVIGEMELDETLASRDVINSKLKTILDEATDKWGTKVNRVELKDITPPREIQLAMEKQMQAERERRAQVLSAEGDKEARISRSEGLKQEEINLAEGHREAQIRRAEGESSAIRQVAEAKKDALSSVKSVLDSSAITAQFLIATNYLETLANFESGEGDKVFIPYEASTALGSLGSIKELMNGKSNSNGSN